MYDFDSYQYRKNPEASIAAFRLAAANRSDALLLIKTINADKYPEKYAALKKNVADLNNVVFLDRFLTRQQVFDLEYCCNCMISLHRAEGFGLGPAEMMYLGKPVIATGWSANMEFMTPMNSFPVNYELKILEEPIGVYEAGQEWAEADIEHAADCLQRLLDETGLELEIGQRAARSIRKQLSVTEIGRQYRDRLVLIAKRHGL
jgi:glycosyltransferase involved in cell wall biosynthesis